MPPQEADTIFERLLQDLPDTWAQKAREFKAFSRRRKITTPTDLMRVVLAYCGLDYTQRETAAMLTLLGIQMSDTAVAERLKACLPWVKALLADLLGHHALDAVRAQGRRFVVVDSSNVTGPGAKGSQYRLHIEMDLLTLEFLRVRITDKRTGDTLKDVAVEAGAVIVADRGYAHAAGVGAVWRAGGDLVVRHRVGQLPISDQTQARVAFAERLADQPADTHRTIAGFVTSDHGEHIRVWVHCWRLSERAAAEARRKVRRARRKSKGGAKPETLLLAGWVMVVTTIAPEQMDAATILELYGCRWQVELAIKRWKSVLDVDGLRGREGTMLSQVWLHGKMLYALMIDRRARRLAPKHWGLLDAERTGTWWRVWKMVRRHVHPVIDASPFWEHSRWPEAIARLMERPRRKRRLQRIPPAGLEFLRRFPDAPQREAPSDALAQSA